MHKDKRLARNPIQTDTFGLRGSKASMSIMDNQFSLPTVLLSSGFIGGV